MLADRLAEKQVNALDENRGQVPSLHNFQVGDVRQGRVKFMAMLYTV